MGVSEAGGYSRRRTRQGKGQGVVDADKRAESPGGWLVQPDLSHFYLSRFVDVLSIINKYSTLKASEARSERREVEARVGGAH